MVPFVFIFDFKKVMDLVKSAARLPKFSPPWFALDGLPFDTRLTWASTEPKV